MVKNFKLAYYHIMLFFISGMVIFNFYVGIKTEHMAERTQQYTTQINQLKNENQKLTDSWKGFENTHASHTYQSAYANLKLDYLESQLNSRNNLEFYLTEIKRMTPTMAQIDQITFKDKTIQIQATTGNYSDIGYYVKELTNSGLFTNVDYSFETNDKTVGDFTARTLNCQIVLTL